MDRSRVRGPYARFCERDEVSIDQLTSPYSILCPSEIRRVDRIWKTISFSQGRANKKIVLRHGCLRRIVRQDCEKDSRWLPAGKKGRVTSK
ncbi:MAG: hypothetical protein PWP34_1537 [Desulfuromonadales bacterium]|nr:hypothetical protein [Desulfuromonadales bacterium]